MGIKIGVCNEYGKLREAFVGIEDKTVEPEWRPELRWLSKDMQMLCKQYGGRRSATVVPDMIRELRRQIEGHVKVLKDYGVKVHRNKPLKHRQEETFLDDVQKGRVYTGGADFFRVIGDNLILLNNLRYPFRRKQVWTVRPALEPLLEKSNARYVALPPVSPHYSNDDMYLENGDLMIDGYNVFAGISGNATN